VRDKPRHLWLGYLTVVYQKVPEGVYIGFVEDALAGQEATRELLIFQAA
jgi:hypothetical protein